MTVMSSTGLGVSAMVTNVYTLREYADILDEIATNWDGDPAAVLVGDIAADSLSVGEKDGYTQHGVVGYATEAFDDNGVWALGQKADTRFYGTMLVDRDALSEEGKDALDERDGGGEAGE